MDSQLLTEISAIEQIPKVEVLRRALRAYAMGVAARAEKQHRQIKKNLQAVGR